MTHALKTIVLVVSLAFVLLAAAAFAPPVAAASVSYTLFGGRSGGAVGNGWSFNNTRLSSPGPTLTATVGDTVTITVNRTDNRFHSWYLDYNATGAWEQADEPGADFPNATTLQAVTFSFVADRTRTFQYRSDGGGDGVMFGNFTIAPAGGLFGGDNTVLVIAGSVVIIVAVLAFAAFFWRRMKTPPPPPKK